MPVDERNQAGRRVLLVLDRPSGLPVIIVIVREHIGEREVFLKLVVPELRRLMLLT